MNLKTFLIAAAALFAPAMANAHGDGHRYGYDHGYRGGHGYDYGSGYGYRQFRPRAVFVPRFRYPIVPVYYRYIYRGQDHGWYRPYHQRWNHWRPRHGGHHGRHHGGGHGDW